MTINLDMYQTLGLATVVLLFGAWMRKKIRVLEKFCIPAPVAGGLLYALIMYALYANKIIEFNYDETLKKAAKSYHSDSAAFNIYKNCLHSHSLNRAVIDVSSSHLPCFHIS